MNLFRTAPRLSLSRRIFTLAFVNVFGLLLVFLIFAHYQFHLEFGSFMLAPVRDRLEDVGAAVALDLQQTPASLRTELMARYAAGYGVDFYLFDNKATQLAGRPVHLPPQVVDELLRPPDEGPPRGGRPPGPPPRGAAEDRLMRRPPPPPPARGRPPRPFGPAVRQTFQLAADDIFWVGTRIPVAQPGSEEIVRGTVILSAKSFYGTPLFFDFKPWLEALAAVTAIFLLCWLPLIRSLTATISRITKVTESIEQGNFDHHLPEDRTDELGQLSVSINRMASRLAGFVSGQKRFLGDIAHELCAPIARMQFGLGILEQRAGDSERPALEDVQEEMRQMSGLVAELLSFSKAGMQKTSRVLDRIDVREIAIQAIDRERGDREDLHVDLAEPLFAVADREYLLRSLCNLVRNAVRYSGNAGEIRISARRDHESVVLLVSDCGPGLPPEELDRVFTPFYRLEASRNREHGGVGLGLAIVRSCVEGCRGTVQCRNRQPTGLEVEIRLAAA